MRRETYQRGVPGAKWGIWNCSRKEFQFDICEDTPMLAVARLFQKIGDDAKNGALSRGSFQANISHFRPVLDIGFCAGFDA